MCRVYKKGNLNNNRFFNKCTVLVRQRQTYIAFLLDTSFRYCQFWLTREVLSMHVQTSTTKCNSLPFCRYRTIFKGVIYHVIARKFLRSNFLIVLGQNNIWNLCLQHFALVETLHMLPTSSLVCKQKKRVFEQERSHILTSTFFRLFLYVEVHSIQQVSVWREETLFIQNQINFDHFPSHKTSANFRRRKKQPWTIQQYSWLPTWAISLIQCSEGMHHFSSLFESCWVVP